jgi:cell division protein FtsW
MTAQTQTRSRMDVPGFFKIDYILLGVVLALLIIGLIMIWSVTFQPNVGSVDPESDFVSQGKYALIGLLVLVVLRYVDYRIWGRLSVPLMAITLLALIALFFTPPVNGARRWLFNGSIQPSELAKFVMVVYMARWLSSKGDKLRNVTYGLIPFSIIVGIVTGLIILQPNISTAIIIGLCTLAMFFIAGADAIQFALLMISGAVAMLIVTFNTEHALQRILTFLSDPLAIAGAEGYQVKETLIALGSGGLLGRGLGSGYAKWGYVPAPHTDSIFALLGEEMGLFGTWLVLGLFLLIVYRGFRIAARTKDPFGQVLAAGLTFWLIFQAFINIGVVTATIPFTGVPLPFISFGGSSLVMTLAAIGVLLNISQADPAKETNATFNFGWRNGGARVPRADRRRRTTKSNSR